MPIDKDKWMDRAGEIVPLIIWVVVVLAVYFGLKD